VAEEPAEDEEPEEGSAYAETSRDYDGLTIWKAKPSDEVLEAERLKESLIKQHDDDHFGPDESDALSDEEAWAQNRREAFGEDA
jgi:hypothetical protein